MNQSPIFVLGTHKSGTSLLRSIFDGHSDLFVIPIETHFFQHLGYWITYGIRKRQPEDLNNSEIIQNFIAWIEKSNTVPGGNSDSDTRGFWDLCLFKKEINKLYNSLKVKNDKDMIQIFIKSMYKSLYNNNLDNDTRVLEKSVDQAEFAIELKKMYPMAKFIHIIRNPYSNLVSIRRFKSKKRYPFLKPILDSMSNNYYYLEKNKRLIAEDYYILKYEDLVKEPETQIKKMTNFLEIIDEDVLYKPTVQGKLWKGNSTSNVKFKGISSNRLNKWKIEINPLEIALINKEFKHILERFNYEFINSNKSYLKISKNEEIKYYIANRLFYKYYL